MFGIKRLRRENALLRESLDWYATSGNWRRRGAHAKGDPVKWIKSPAAFDRGARAKFTLTQIYATAALNLPLPVATNTTDTE
jgi:hypothetical protein